MNVDSTRADEFAHLIAYLRDARGFDAAPFTPGVLAARIDARVAATGADGYADYVDYLEVHPDEFRPLFDAILLNVTAFFRDPETFACLREVVLPGLLAGQRSGEPIRVWSAGCASGEECYSVAMLLADAIGLDDYGARVKIYATDVDEGQLAIARAATYPDERMADVPDALRARYFDREPGGWRAKNTLRRRVFFGRHDLRDDAPISRVDLLVCRNTLLYFNLDAQRRIAGRFRFALRDGGYLVLGRAETLRVGGHAFSTQDPASHVFVKDAGRDTATGPVGDRTRLAVVTLSEALRIETWSTGAARMLGIATDRALGRTLAEAGIDSEELGAALTRLVTGAASEADLDLDVQSPNGAPIRIHAVPIGGTPRRLVLVVQAAGGPTP
ncbi:MAG: protein-glutamate O-methyltransferase CheR [Acidimicrobiia bacterium]|nr:protein-glutamate O-methyltransferase CheR [Acidimicrobiia bacterium]